MPRTTHSTRGETEAQNREVTHHKGEELGSVFGSPLVACERCVCSQKAVTLVIRCDFKNIWYTEPPRTVTKPSSSLEEKERRRAYGRKLDFMSLGSVNQLSSPSRDARSKEAHWLLSRACVLDAWFSVSLASGSPASGRIAEAQSRCRKGQLLAQVATEIISKARTPNDSWGSRRQHAGWILQDGDVFVDRRQFVGRAPKTTVHACQWSVCKGRTEVQRPRAETLKPHRRASPSVERRWCLAFSGIMPCLPSIPRPGALGMQYYRVLEWERHHRESNSLLF